MDKIETSSQFGDSKLQSLIIDYFTRPFTSQNIQKENENEIHQILSTLTYQPIDEKIIKQFLHHRKSSEFTEDDLLTIFKFQIRDVLAAIQLSNFVLNSAEKISKSSNFNIVFDVIFRGFLELTIFLKIAFDHEFAQKSMQIFTPDDWKSLHLIIDFLMIYSKSNFDNFILALNPILLIYSNNAEKILSANNNGYIQIDFQKFLSSMLSLSSISSNIIDFLNCIIKLCLSYTNEYNFQNEYFLITNFYIQKMICIASNLTDSQRSEIISIALLYLSHFTSETDKGFFTHGFESLRLLTEVIFSYDSSLHEVDSVLSFFEYTTSHFFSTENLLSSIITPINEDTQLQFQTNEQYFKHEVVFELSQSKYAFSTPILHKVSGLFESLLQNEPFRQEILKCFFQRTKNHDQIHRNELFLLLIVSLFGIENLSTFFISFLFEIFYGRSVLIIPNNQLHQVLLDNIFLFAFKRMNSNNELYSSILTPFINSQDFHFEQILIYMKLFRSLLLQNIIFNSSNFIEFFLGLSNLFNCFELYLENPDYQQQTDEMINLIQLLIQNYPKSVFSSTQLCSIIFKVAAIDRYMNLIVPCIQIGIRITKNNLLGSIIHNITLSFDQLSDSTKFENLKELSTRYLNILKNSLDLFSKQDILVISSQHFLVSVASIVQRTKDEKMMNDVITILFTLDQKSPNKIPQFESPDSTVFSSLIESFKCIDLTMEQIELLFNFSLDETIEFNNKIPTIQNAAILKLLIEITRDTSFEEYVLDKLILLCRGSASNAFECFHIDVINYLLELMHKDKYRLKALGLYQTISSLYFSPLSLYETFDSLYSTAITKTSNFHQMILHCFLALIIEKRPNPVNRFFHLNGHLTGIKCENVDEYYSQNWYFVTTIRLDSNSNSFDPLISVIDQQNTAMLFHFSHNKLYFKRSSLNNQGDINTSEFFFSEVTDSDSTPSSSSSIFSLKKDHDTKPFSGEFGGFTFENNSWYQIVIAYTSQNILLYVNGKHQSSIELPKGFVMNGNISIEIGRFANNSFTGDLGPILFLGNNTIPKSHNEYIDQILKDYPDSSYFNQFPTIMVFDPGHCNGNEISDVTSKGLSAELIGKAVPFSETLYNVIQYAGTFERFLPLFSICNDLQTDETVDTNSKAVDDQLFHILLVILKLFLEISSEMEKSFESIGGFQLLVGLFALLKPKSISVYVPLDLADIYKSLKTESLKNQMVEYIWLNFSFWSSLTYNVQISFYKNALQTAYTFDKSPFQLKTYDFLLFQIESKLYLKEDNADNDIPSSQINTFLSKSEMEEIKSLQWNFFDGLFKSNKGTICFLYMILSFNDQKSCRKHAYDIFLRLLENNDSEMMQSIKLWDRIDYFLDSFLITPAEVLNCLYDIGKFLQKGQLISPSDFNLNLGLFSASILLKNNDQLVENIDDLFNQCQNYVFLKEENQITFNVIEFLPILSFLTFYSSKPLIEAVYGQLIFSISTDYETFESFTVENPCWPFFIFVISNNFNEIYGIFIAIIQKNPSLITTIVNFIEFIQLSLHYDMFPSLSVLFVSLLQRSIIDLKLLYSVIFQSILFPVSFDNLATFSQLTKEEIFTLFDHLSDLDQFLQIQRRYHPQFHEQLFNCLLESLVSDNKVFSVVLNQDLEFDTFFWYSYVLSVLIIQTHQYSLFKDYESKAIQLNCTEKFTDIQFSRSFVYHAYQVVRDCSDFTLDLNPEQNLTSAYDFLLNIFINQKIEFISQICPMTNFIKQAINFGQNYDRQSNQSFLMAYKDAVERQQQSRLIVENYNIKLAQSFIQECESNGGPLSKGPPKQVKWKWSNRIDYLFRPTIYSINLSFDDHASASRMRDSQPLPDINNQEQVIPFKRILDQNVSLVDSNIQKEDTNIQTIASYEVINLKVNIRYQGNLNILSNTISFEGKGLCDGLGQPFQSQEQRTNTNYIKIPFDSIEFIFLRSHLYEDVACEVYTQLNKSYFFIFNDQTNRNRFLSIIKKEIDSRTTREVVKSALKRTISQNQCMFDINGDFDFFASLRKVTGCHIQTMPASELLSKSGIVEAWRNRSITNFMYLLVLNILAQRSMNDLSKYPVFPWILSDYSSEEINLDDPNVYRRLDTPLGAYNSARFANIKIQQQNCFDKIEYCLYRTHYSSAASVIGYLIRTEPFTSLHINLQNGKFDHPNRLFFSIEQTWFSVSHETSDFRELIPQFFCDPHFLMNENGFDLGRTMNGHDVANVTLPNWAHNSAYRFIEIQRMAIESEYVSQHLNNWIDLIFGVYQRSEEQKSLFHMFSYPDCLQSPLVKDDYTRQMAKYHGVNFGICCDQIFFSAHPVRKSLLPRLLSGLAEMQLDSVYYFDNDCILLKNGDLLCVDNCQVSQNAQIKLKELQFYSTIFICKYFKLIFLIPRGGNFLSVIEYKTDGSPANEIKRLTNSGSSISCIEIVGNRWLLTGGNDCTICILSLPTLALKARLSIQSRPVMCMSCCEFLDIIVSIDENHQVWCYSLFKPRLYHTFQVHCPSNSKHQILVIQSGFIIISSTSSYSINNKFHSHIHNKTCYENERHCIDVFDLHGNFVKNIAIESSVVKLRYINLLSSDSYIVASLENRSLILIKISSFELLNLIPDEVLPDFFSIDDVHKEIHYVAVESGVNNLKTFRF